MGAADATLALRENRLRSAGRELERLLRDPDPDSWRYAVTALSSGGKDPKAAARVLGEVVDLGAVPDDLQVWLVLGGLAQRLGDAALTEHIVDGVIERFTDEPRVALLRASTLPAADKPDQARAVLSPMAAARTLPTALHLLQAAELDPLGGP